MTQVRPSYRPPVGGTLWIALRKFINLSTVLQGSMTAHVYTMKESIRANQKQKLFDRQCSHLKSSASFLSLANQTWGTPGYRQSSRVLVRSEVTRGCTTFTLSKILGEFSVVLVPLWDVVEIQTWVPTAPAATGHWLDLEDWRKIREKKLPINMTAIIN